MLVDSARMDSVSPVKVLGQAIGGVMRGFEFEFPCALIARTSASELRILKGYLSFNIA